MYLDHIQKNGGNPALQGSLVQVGPKMSQREYHMGVMKSMEKTNTFKKGPGGGDEAKN